jgi:hypothetical protein
MAIWVVCKIVDSFMHFIYTFIARMLAKRLARYARAINTSTSLREVSIAEKCILLFTGWQNDQADVPDHLHPAPQSVPSGGNSYS